MDPSPAKRRIALGQPRAPPAFGARASRPCVPPDYHDPVRIFENGISLANKCVLLFGGAVVVIVVAAMTVPWFRMTALIDAGQLELSRQMARTWDDLGEGGAPSVGAEERAGIVARSMSLAEATMLAPNDRFVREALERFQADPTMAETQEARWVKTNREYRYASAVRGAGEGAPVLAGLILLERRSVEATRLLVLNSAFLLSAGAVVLALSLAVFYVITHRLILEPVRSLRDTAERVREGSLSIRSDIKTGDEFQELAETFNSMLTDLQGSQDQLRSVNAALDVKVTELAQANTALYEAAKLKGEFLANVSHELRTPLNSIIGFAELLLEIARGDAKKDPSPVVLKRIRYGENIVIAGRNLMSLINTLLEMAKIEAGKVEVAVETVVLRDLCDRLAGLIYPMAEKKGIQVRLEVGEDVGAIRTDAKKLQQIIFNFLSNAVKFTEPKERSGRDPVVTLRAERLVGAGAGDERVRLSVIDNGPGIAKDDQLRIFEKFHQLDNSHTREHTGTGLGLAISKELATILHGQIQLESEPGTGSMFSVIVPRSLEAAPAAESELENRFRGVLAGRREWDA